ncbi:T3SS effector HopA1 family protein [Streptomyces sp. NPDC048392]|uniref:T3SS effector HopA1 family protein n=1 Tax=Streptomyces sp. NPDC048392 TaxID=3365543 RepID=UPI00371FEEF3
MRRLLSESIYDVHHAGQPDGQVPSRLRDRELEARLVEVVPHREITVRAVLRSGPERMTDDGPERFLVEREGVRFWAPRSALPGTVDGGPGDRVDLVMPSARPALSPGFFLVDGSRQRRGAKEVLRVYLHVADVEHAVGVWQAALTFLEDHAVPYRAKMLSAAELYPRRDSIVVYLDGELAAIAPELAEAVAQAPGLEPAVSSFAQELRPGIATAWEPVDTQPGMQGLSFGQHRATVLAAALVDSAEDPSQTERKVVEHFVAAAIDPARPAHNRTP